MGGALSRNAAASLLLPVDVAEEAPRKLPPKAECSCWLARRLGPAWGQLGMSVGLVFGNLGRLEEADVVDLAEWVVSATKATAANRIHVLHKQRFTAGNCLTARRSAGYSGIRKRITSAWGVRANRGEARERGVRAAPGRDASARLLSASFFPQGFAWGHVAPVAAGCWVVLSLKSACWCGEGCCEVVTLSTQVGRLSAGISRTVPISRTVQGRVRCRATMFALKP